MPIGGETVGRAYVRILTDGSEVPDGIRDSLENKDTDKAFEQAGNKHSKLYNEAYKSEQDKNRPKIKKLLTESLQIGSGDMDARAKNIADGLLDSLQTQLRSRFSKKDTVIADQIWQNILGDYKSGTPIEALAKRLRENLPREVEQATAQVVSIEDAYRRDREAAYKENNRRLVEDFTTSYHLMAQGITELERGEKKASVTHRQSIFEVRRLRELLETLPGSERDKLSGDLDLLDRRVRQVTPVTSRFSRVVDDLSDGLGRATGRGSRNNFLNFLGSANRGLTRLVLLGPKIALEVGERMTTAFLDGGKGLSGLASAGQALLPMAGAAAAGIAGIGIAVGLLLVGLGPMVALFSGLLGILTALSSTVIFALIGGLVGVAGALVPLVAGIGVAVAGFASMDDELKNRLSKTLGPVKDQLSDLGQVLRDELFRDVPQQAKLMTNILEDLEPVTRRVAAAVRDVGTSWLDALDSPGFRQFTDRMEVFLPRSIRRLGEIAENTASALGGMFEASLPFITRFLENLIDVTDQWSEWANSREGKNDVKDFLDSAADSADSLGGFLGKVIGLVSELLDQGNDTGNNIFDDMANAIEKFTTKLEENPEMLDQWYEDAKKLADEIGDLVVDLGELFDELDSEENRQAARDIVDIFGDLADALSDMEETLGPIIGPLVDLIGLLSELYELSQKDIVFDISFGDLLNLPMFALGQLIEQLEKLKNMDINIDFKGMLGKVGDIFSGIKWSALIPDIKWSSLIPDVKWSSFVPDVRWSSFVPNVRWLSFIPSIRWLSFIPNLRWLSFIPSLRWLSFIPDIKWSSFIPNIDWDGLIPDIDWGSLIPDISWSSFIPSLSWSSFIPGMASGGRSVDNGTTWASGGIGGPGGITRGAVLRWIGEDGPEAVVPLDRDLSRVDPSVRWLSAIAQGLDGAVAGMAAGGQRGRSIDASGWTIISPQTDARAVAEETLVRLFATSYT